MKKIIIGIVTIVFVAGTAVFANYYTTKKADCCEKGSSCCHPGAACCKGK